LIPLVVKISEKVKNKEKIDSHERRMDDGQATRNATILIDMKAFVRRRMKPLTHSLIPFGQYNRNPHSNQLMEK